MSGPLAVHRSGPAGDLPLVLLHAFPLDSQMWQPVLRRLSQIPVLAIDAPGFGASPPSQEGLTGYGRQVVAALAANGVDRAVLAGQSMGGYAALAVAEQAPQLLAGLGLLGTKASADDPPARERRWQMIAAVERGEQQVASSMVDALLGGTSRAQRPAIVAQLRSWLSKAPAAGLVWAQRSMATRPDRLAALAALPAGLPSAVLHGKEDALMTFADAQAMAGALAVPVTELAGVGHLSALEDPDVVAGHLAALHQRALLA